MVEDTVLDPRVRRFVRPTRVVWQTGVGETGESDSAVERGESLVASRVDQTGLEAGPGCVLRHAGRAPGILLDFGCELHGGVQIIVGDTAFHRPVRVRVRFGESVSEAMADDIRELFHRQVSCETPRL